VITQTLIDKGFTDDEIAAVMGGNVTRVFTELLPRN
jgi:microsomal dipeptidase-like Zn-dependent dipeptidase